MYYYHGKPMMHCTGSAVYSGNVVRPKRANNENVIMKQAKYKSHAAPEQSRSNRAGVSIWFDPPSWIWTLGLLTGRIQTPQVAGPGA